MSVGVQIASHVIRGCVRRATRIAVVAAATAASLGTGTAAAAPPIILHGGSIFTADPARPWAQAIQVEGGKITAVGADVDILGHAPPNATKIPLGGRVVIPGFNDAHVHVAIPEGTYLNTPDFLPGPGPTLAEIKTLISGGAATNAPGSWLFAYIGSAIFDDPQATRLALDTVSPDHPVALFGWTGHGTWINTKAMTVLGISATQPDPFGGHFVRFPKSDVITGEAHEYAEFDLRRRMLGATPDAKVITRYKAFADTAIQLGYTSLQDMAVGLPHSRALNVLRAAKLPLRVRAICFPMTPGELCDLTAGTDDDLVRGAGVKWITDGTPVERLSFVNLAYLDRPGLFGAPDLTQPQIKDQLNAHKLGAPARHQMLFHGVGDAAIDNILEAMLGTGGAVTWHDRRTRIEHGEMLFAAERNLARDLGVVVVQNPTHFALAPVFAQRFVPEVFAQLEPMQTLLAQNIPLAIGTDAIGAPQSPFLNLFLAMIHPTHPSEALTLEQALIAFTRGSAYAEFQDTRKGMLSPGLAADLAVLSQDIFHIAPPDLLSTTSVLTLVDGRIVWDAGVVHPTR